MPHMGIEPGVPRFEVHRFTITAITAIGILSLNDGIEALLATMLSEEREATGN